MLLYHVQTARGLFTLISAGSAAASSIFGGFRRRFNGFHFLKYERVSVIKQHGERDNRFINEVIQLEAASTNMEIADA